MPRPTPGSDPEARPAQREPDQQRYRPAGRTLLAAAAPGGARDVEVRPFELAREAREVAGRGDAARRAPAGVRHVGEVRAQLFLVVLPQRHLPYEGPGILARG